MAEEVKKTVLVEADIVANFVEAKRNLDNVKQGYKDLEKDVEKASLKIESIRKKQGENSKAFIDAKAKLDGYNKSLSEQAKLLASANNQYKDAKKAIEGAAKSEDILNNITEKANKSLGEMQRELTALKNVDLSGLKDGQIREVQQAMADLTAKIQDTKNEIKGLDTGQVFANLASTAQMATAGMQVFSTVLGSNNETVKQLNDATVKLIATTQALGVITDYLTKKKYQLLLANIKNIASMVAEKVAATGAAAANYLMAKSTIAASVGFKALRTAIISTGIGALLVGIGLLIANFDKIVKWFNSSNSAADKAAKSIAKYEKAIENVSKAIDAINSNEKTSIEELKKKHREVILAMQARNAKSEEIAAQEAKNQKELTDVTTQYSDRRMSELEKEQKAQEKAYDDQKKLYEQRKRAAKILNEVGADKSAKAAAKLAEEEFLKLKELAEARNQLNNTIKNEATVRENSLLDAQEKNIQATDKEKKAAYDASMKRIDLAEKLGKSELDAKRDLSDESFSTQQQYEKNMFNLEQKSAYERLSIQKQYGEITQSEYNSQYEVLMNLATAFNNQQTQAAKDELKKRQKELAQMLKDDSDIQIAEAKEQAERMKKALEDDAKKLKGSGKIQFNEEGDITGGDQEAINQYKQYYVDMLKVDDWYKEERTRITKEGEEARAALINKDLDNLYKSDLDAFSNNEIKKLELEQSILEQRIEAKKNQGLYTGDDEAALKANNLQLLQANADRELAITAKTEAEKYKIQREADLKKLASMDETSLEYAQLLEKMRNDDTEYQQSQIQMWSDYASKAMEVFGALKDIATAGDEDRVARAEETNQKEHDSLQKQLDANLITKAEYDAKIKESDEKLAKEKAAIARKQAVMDKAMAVFQVGVSTATAVMNALNTKPFLPMGPAMAALAAAMGAAQLAAVVAKPIPQAARGRLIGGASHAAGGTLIEAERGEAIINKRSVGLFPELLSLINEVGGGVPFARPFSDGGFSAREFRRQQQAPVINYDEMAEAMAYAVGKQKVYTALEDINNKRMDFTETTNIAQ